MLLHGGAFMGPDSNAMQQSFLKDFSYIEDQLNKIEAQEKAETGNKQKELEKSINAIREKIQFMVKEYGQIPFAASSLQKLDHALTEIENRFYASGPKIEAASRRIFEKEIADIKASREECYANIPFLAEEAANKIADPAARSKRLQELAHIALKRGDDQAALRLIKQIPDKSLQKMELSKLLMDLFRVARQKRDYESAIEYLKVMPTFETDRLMQEEMVGRLFEEMIDHRHEFINSRGERVYFDDASEMCVNLLKGIPAKEEISAANILLKHLKEDKHPNHALILKIIKDFPIANKMEELLACTQYPLSEPLIRSVLEEIKSLNALKKQAGYKGVHYEGLGFVVEEIKGYNEGLGALCNLALQRHNNPELALQIAREIPDLEIQDLALERICRTAINQGALKFAFDIIPTMSLTSILNTRDTLYLLILDRLINEKEMNSDLITKVLFQITDEKVKACLKLLQAPIPEKVIMEILRYGSEKVTNAFFEIARGQKDSRLLEIGFKSADSLLKQFDEMDELDRLMTPSPPKDEIAVSLLQGIYKIAFERGAYKDAFRYARVIPKEKRIKELFALQESFLKNSKGHFEFAQAIEQEAAQILAELRKNGQGSNEITNRIHVLNSVITEANAFKELQEGLNPAKVLLKQAIELQKSFF